MLKLRLPALLAAAFAALVSVSSQAAQKDHFSVCWTIYAGWMPWEYAGSQGIVDKWAKKYGIQIDVVQLNDYVESINQYTAGQFDGCTMTNMDALTIPAAGGVDSTALIVSDFSNGNDGIVGKTAKSLAELKGASINLVELSVSHYLLARALDQAGLAEKDVTVVNTSDADIVSVFSGTADVQNVVTWNPLLSEVAAFPSSTELFNSSQIPGEIIDLMVVNTATLKDNPALGKALTGAWFEVMALMKAGNTPAITHMAKASGTTLADYQSQLKTTALMFTPADAVSFVTSPKLADTMKRVSKFSFDKKLLGDGAKSADAIGVAFPGGAVNGNAKNTKLRFDDTYLRLAADGKL